MLKLKKIIEESSGFQIVSTTKEDIKTIKKIIQDSFDLTLKKNNIEPCLMDDYHKLKISDNLHKKIWTRKNRLANKKLIDYLKYKSKIFKILKKEFGSLSFSKKVEKNKPDVYWRIVRPNKKNDVGPIHADEWFWKANRWTIPRNKKLLKIWFLLSDNLDRGLLIIPNSHLKKNWKYKKIYKDNIFKPKFDEKRNFFKIKALKTPKGKILFFNYRLLHTGLINNSKSTRISLEFTVFYRE